MIFDRELSKRKEEEARKMYEEYLDGKTLREVGEARQITRQRVLQIFQRYGFKTRGQTVSDLQRQHFERIKERAKQRKKLIPKEILLKLTKKEIPLKQVLEEFECTYASVIFSRKHHGIQPEERRKNPELTDALLKELFVDKMLPASRIAEMYGYKKGSIAIKLHRLGISRKSATEQERS